MTLKGKDGEESAAQIFHEIEVVPGVEEKPEETKRALTVREIVPQRPSLPPVAPARALTRTPADSVPVPEPDEDGFHDLSRPEYLLNRELTWLNFNFRVLHEAEDERTPLLERLKFIAIVSSNVDEFVMKRIGGLKQLVGAGIHEPSADGRTPQEQLDECNKLVRKLEKRKRRALLALLPRLEEHGIRIVSYNDLAAEDKAYLRELYFENYYPLVTPQATDPAHPFPFISNLSLNLLVTLRHSDESDPRLARVKVPEGAIPRLLELRDSKTFVRFEDVMANNLDLLFPGMVIDEVAMFRVTRNANTEREEEKAEDLLALIESELRDRKFAPIVRLEVSDNLSLSHRGMLAAELGLDEAADVFEVEGMQGMRDLMQLTSIPDPALHDAPFHPVDHLDLVSERNIFHVIREAGSVLLHHPYISFATSVERFLSEASSDPKVRAIKMCLYRTSADTQVLNYLIDAARNDKQVAVVVELKARFDEQANIRWAARLEEAGIHVTYGVVGLKTHCKVVLVVRQDHDGLRRYAHVGTGNYHAGTARLYSDLGLLTCGKHIGQDLTELFNYLSTGYKPKRRYKRILPAPKTCRHGLLMRIEREIQQHAEGSPGLIQMKMNALEDARITRALYRASQAGVQVDLIIRDTCRLRPGIPGLSENARVISVVGRFLEHARIAYFRNDGDEEYFIGSADLMRRNLNSRVEVLAPVESPDLREELRTLLDIQLEDTRCAWEMQSDGSYVQRTPAEGDEVVKGSQEQLIDLYAKRRKRSHKLKRRKPQGFNRRNIR
ncbi:MAG: polyphosphate kinase 1 [bacterium]|nr:polyphosphate kinase 1 [bacterium]